MPEHACRHTPTRAGESTGTQIHTNHSVHTECPAAGGKISSHLMVEDFGVESKGGGKFLLLIEHVCDGGLCRA